MSYIVGRCEHDEIVAATPTPDTIGALVHDGCEMLEFGALCAEWLDRGLTVEQIEADSVEIRKCEQCRDLVLTPVSDDLFDMDAAEEQFLEDVAAWEKLSSEKNFTVGGSAEE